MSTRATYTVKTPQSAVTYYIHHDGYPAGVAEYIKAALFHANARGSFADRFLRANDGAEHTGGKDVHGDTEFHYDIKQKQDGTITVEQFTVKYGENRSRSFVSNGVKDIADFINDAMADGHRQQIAYYTREGRATSELLPPEKVFMLNNRYYTLESARNEFIEKVAAYQDYALKFPHYTGNVESGIRTMQSAFGVYAALVESGKITKVA